MFHGERVSKFVFISEHPLNSVQNIAEYSGRGCLVFCSFASIYFFFLFYLCFCFVFYTRILKNKKKKKNNKIKCTNAIIFRVQAENIHVHTHFHIIPQVVFFSFMKLGIYDRISQNEKRIKLVQHKYLKLLCFQNKYEHTSIHERSCLYIASILGRLPPEIKIYFFYVL